MPLLGLFYEGLDGHFMRGWMVVSGSINTSLPHICFPYTVYKVFALNFGGNVLRPVLEIHSDERPPCDYRTFSRKDLFQIYEGN